ncbi:MAG: D-alanyl-D-alanine carboxypeptidase/D-alanyl-D-alanine-endopeptidase [Desulfomonilaceae bacterium]|nr:D-alanyl-D-alanine carboxypeptidase/D-alanyl-D-alanine-endopeptidase [Desulfomonilaceae bacterium]
MLFVHLGSSHGEAAGVPQLNNRLEAIVTGTLPSDYAVSALVVDLETGQVLMELHPDRPLTPASTMKVVTSATALSLLKPDFAFVTEVLTDKAGSSSIGEVYLKGTGDPYLVSEELFALTRGLKENGLQEITGNIIVDDSYFIPGKPLDEREELGHRSYHAPYGALSLNFNSIKILVHPADRIGRPARVVMDPTSEYAVVRGSVKTVRGNACPRPAISKKGEPGEREIIEVTGEIGVNAQARGVYVNVASPALYTGKVFKEFLLREGVRVTGKVIRGKTPPSAVSYLEFKSRPLGSIVYWLNKFSNNFMAEQICLAVGAQAHGVPGTREKGLAVIRKYLLSCGVDEGSFSLSDASGLSLSNKLSASAIVRVLVTASRDFSYNAEFMASLGISGIDGTLREKFTDGAMRRRIRAKTGTLRGVNALAGYGVSRDGRTVAFAVLVNNLKQGAGFVSYADDIVRAVMELPMGARGSR